MEGFFAKHEILETVTVPTVALCEKCRLYQGCETPKMGVSGLGRKRILIVGEAPSVGEDETGRAYTGNSGRELQRAMRKFGVDLERDCWRTNAVICRPPDRTPTNLEIGYCRPNIMRTIRKLKPTVIIVLGESALLSVIEPFWKGEIGGLERWIGWNIPSVDLNAWICPMHHPAFILREDKPNRTAIWERHLQKAVELHKSRPHDEIPDYKSQIELIFDADKVAKIIRQQRGAGSAAFDYETTMLKPEGAKAEIVSASIAWDERTIAFPWSRDTAAIMREFVRGKTYKIAANFKFEERWTRKFLKTKVKNWYWDTMLNAHILDNRSGITSLKFQAFVLLGVPNWNAHIGSFLEGKTSMTPNRVKELDRRDLLLYNGFDALYELHVAKKQRALMSGKIGLARKLLHEGSLALADVEAAGITLDVQYMDEQIEATQQQIDIDTQELQQSKVFRIWEKTFGTKTNLNSTQQLGHVLFTKMKHKAIATTPSGKPKTDISSLERLDSPFVRKFLGIKKKKKAKSTYLQGILREADPNSLVHPVFNLHLVQTYRGSADTPNFQNIPVRDAEVSKLVRSGFVPRKGCRIVEVDYAGIEVRVAACYHKDPNMLSYIHDPSKDMHRDMAAECFILRQKEVNKTVRYCGKNMFVFPQFYGSIYPDCAKSLWEACRQLKLSVGEPGSANEVPMLEHLQSKGITELGDLDPKAADRKGTFVTHIKKVERNFWEKRFPVYDQWKKTWYNEYLEKLEFTTLTNFRCSGFMKRNEVINYPVQGSAFHCLLWSLIELQKALKKKGMKTKIVGQIHDSIVADVPEDEFEDYLRMAHDIMTQRIRLFWSWIIVPLEIEAEASPVGGTWYDKAPVDLREILEVD
jgi:uracil-DNA glycosylase family 4